MAVASRLSDHELSDRLATVPDTVLLDVRGAAEREAGAIDPSSHVPMSALIGNLGSFGTLGPFRP